MADRHRHPHGSTGSSSSTGSTRLPPPTDAAEAREAVEQATARLSEGYHRWPQVRRAAESLTRTYQENHLAERVKNAFGGRA